MARSVMDQLKTDGKVSRSKLGVTIQNVTADIAASLKLPDVSGALVSGVEPGSAAARAGLRQGDVIVSIDGEKLADNNALRNRIAGTKPGSKVAIEVLREGRKQTLHATLDAQSDGAKRLEARASGEPDAQGFGMTVQPLTPEVARELELTDRREGVVIRERGSRWRRGRGGPAAWRRHRAGERPGGEVGCRTEVGAQPVDRPAGAAARCAQGRRRIRHAQPREVGTWHTVRPGATRAGTMLHPIDGASPGPLLSRTPQQWRLFQAGEHLARVLQQHEILVGALPLREEGITELACTIRAAEASGDLREPNVCVQRVVLALVPGIVPARAISSYRFAASSSCPAPSRTAASESRCRSEDR